MSDSIQSTLMATAAGTIVATGLWVSGLDAVMWPGHPFLAQLFLAAAATVFSREVWMRHLGRSRRLLPSSQTLRREGQ